MACESGGDPNADNGRGHRWLMQIDGGPLDPKQNLDWAYGMWRRWGWHRSILSKRWSPHQTQGGSVRETGLMWAKALRAFQVGKARTS
ncbi:MAG: hypothetical protein ACRDJO_05010, partial [Actinomycetota bacterium]